ncbi:hypothetical protein D9756_005606 [Leucocoprinus leucothites]|uniref:F-box domain-containing protein n=1 Tax=Leucocoprinus leucothites TaxID=201217 RepID=A0A8H5FZJ7_9AGAR|nr:hypothetical protein D9756_005606 [Leucoagaricus leucothites]
MSSKLLALPDDVLGEILVSLPALSILSCRRVCRKLNQLTNARHIWFTVFNRTQHMLRPTITEPASQPLSKLEMTIVRAEKLNMKFMSDNWICPSPVRAYRLQNRDGLRSPLVIMGEYLVCLAGSYLETTYQWISKRTAHLENGSVAFEYEVPIHMNPHEGQRVADYHLHQMDHDSNTFYVISGPDPADDIIEEYVQLAEFKLDGVSSKPYLSKCSQLAVNPRKRPNNHMSIGRCAVAYYYKPDSGYGINVTIVDFRTTAISHYQLVLPNPPHRGVYFKKHTCVSDTHLLLILNNIDFYIFARPSAHDTTPVQLQPITSGRLPSLTRATHQIFHQISSNSFITVGIHFTGDDDETTNIHLISLKKRNSETDWTVEIETKEIQGSYINAGGSIFAVSPNPKTDCILGILSCESFSEVGMHHDLPESEGITYWLLRIEGLNSDTIDKPPGNHVKLVYMIMKPWVVEGRARDDELCCIDFDPFSGTALLASPPPDTVPGYQSIVALDYL